MSGLTEFTRGLGPYLRANPYARPFVCTGSPLKCRSFIVGYNAATILPKPFTSYWSDQHGFNRKAFECDYAKVRSRKGNRRVVEAISRQLGDCLETNLYAIPSKKSRDLTAKDRESPIIDYLFRAIRPKLVFAHNRHTLRFFEKATDRHGFAEEPKRAEWQGHEFLLFGFRKSRRALFTLSTPCAIDLGKRLAGLLD